MLENQRIRPNQLILLAASLVGLLSPPAHAADWRLTAVRPTQFGLSLSFVDAQSIRGGNGRVQFSALTFFSHQTRRMNRVSTVVTADCQSMRYRFQQIILFRNQQPLSEWHSTALLTATPESNVFDSIGSVCGISDLGTHVEGVEGFAADYFRKGQWRRTRPA
jgi:hypothetical protein